mmetsp:Transcript_53613/g.98739  ORF Transcript_53613/g.98739 Transcript_53613/m.98739 type:complete len:373 (-) Transcript_53613:70-1188(-)
MSGKNICDLEFQDVLPNSPLGVCTCGCCCIVNIVLIILFFPCTVTQLGQFKYGILKNKVTGYVDLDTSYQPGRYWIGFWKEFIEFPSTLNTIEFSNERPEKNVQHLTVLKSRDKDGKQVTLDVSIQYRLDPKDLGTIYKKMLTHYEDIYISELRDALAKAANLFAIQETWVDYNKIVKLMKTRCDEVLNALQAECWGLQLWGVGLTHKYETKLIETQVRKQAQKTASNKKIQSDVRAKTQVMIAEYTKNITILESGGWAARWEIENSAKADAQANVISGSAIVTDIIRETVCPMGLRDIDTDKCMQNISMPGHDLVMYHKLAMLTRLSNSSLVYKMGGNTVHGSPIDVEATKDIIKDPSRRLHSKQHRVPEL